MNRQGREDGGGSRKKLGAKLISEGKEERNKGKKMRQRRNKLTLDPSRLRRHHLETTLDTGCCSRGGTYNPLQRKTHRSPAP